MEKYSLDDLREQYGGNGYRDLLPFMGAELIEDNLPLLLTLMMLQ
jgi:hypothetical protein